MPWCWVTAGLYEDLLFIRVIAVAQACCEPMLQSSTEQWGMHSALSCDAMPWCWVTADLYAQQIVIGVLAVVQACCEPLLQSSTEH